MRKINCFKNILILFFTLTSFSCSNLFEQELGQSISESSNAFITLSVGSGDGSRTVLPGVEESELTTLVLKGTKEGEAESSLGSWASVSEMRNAAIPLSTGSWNFTLTARKGGTSFSGSASKNIIVGENSLSFEMKISDSGSGAGSFSVTLNFESAPNADKVTKALATLENLDGSSVTGVNAQALIPVEKAVTFSADGITAGTYRAKVVFYSVQNGRVLELATYRELVQISDSLSSTATRTIESFDNLYTITYNRNGGVLSEGVTLQESVTRKSAAITLPDLSKDYYTFAGWYTTESFAEGTEVTELSNFTGNVSVYAKFSPVTFTITYVLNGGTNADGAVISYTMDDDITLPTPTKAESAFKGWYKTNDFSDSKLTGWSKGKQHENITLYARWNAYIEVKRSLAESTIKGLTSNTTIKVKDTDSYRIVIRDINAALKELATTNSDVLVTLDISEFESKKVVMDSDKENFKGCTNLEGVIFYSNMYKLEELPDGAFSGCISLESITIPYGVKTIGYSVFSGCTSLKSVTIGTSVTKIYKNVFKNCPSIESITFKSTKTWRTQNIKGELIGGNYTFDDPTDRNIKYMTSPSYDDYTWVNK